MSKAAFAAVPARAIVDTRLLGLHLRTLGAICIHDWMSKVRGKGQGCWLDYKALAVKCSCNPTNMSTAITDLENWGYVVREPHPTDRRRNVYRVIYTDDDFKVQKSAKEANRLSIGKRSARQTICPQANDRHQNEGEVVCPETGEITEIVCPPNSQGIDNTEKPSLNIFREAEERKEKEDRPDSEWFKESQDPLDLLLRQHGIDKLSLPGSVIIEARQFLDQRKDDGQDIALYIVRRELARAAEAGR